jgi:hypothetical protein
VPALLAGRNPILAREMQGIEEDSQSRVEADAVLFSVAAVLVLVPFKERCIYIIAYTELVSHRSGEGKVRASNKMVLSLIH